jgi:hypothetical protein
LSKRLRNAVQPAIVLEAGFLRHEDAQTVDRSLGARALRPVKVEMEV